MMYVKPWQKINVNQDYYTQQSYPSELKKYLPRLAETKRIRDYCLNATENT